MDQEMPDKTTIDTFKDLMNEIVYSWEYPTYDLQKDSDGNFYLNKLYISPTEVSYKTSNYNLAPGVFEDLERFYRFLQSTNPVVKKCEEEREPKVFRRG